MLLFLILPPSTTFYQLLSPLFNLCTTFTNFYHLPPIFITFYQFLPTFALVLPIFDTFYHLSPTFITVRHFLSTFILLFKLTIFHQLYTIFHQSNMVLFLFIHLLICTNPIILLDSILWASILCLSLFYMPCTAYILHQVISLI